MMKSLPYYNKLEKIRNSLEKNVSKFPLNGCGEASLIVERILGFPQVIREYNGINNIKDSSILVDSEFSIHMLNIDKERGLYIDLSKDQFNGKEKICISPIQGNYEYKEDKTLDKILPRLIYNENILRNIEVDYYDISLKNKYKKN